MSIHAVPDERSVKRLGTRLVRAQRQQKRLFVRTAFDQTGGGRGIRTLVTWITGKTVFETAAFNHSAIPPYSIVRAQVCPNHIRQARTYKKSPFGGENSKWRRDGDSNPRYAFGAYTISNRAPSASSDISPLHHLLRNAICIAAEGKYSAE